MIQAILGNSQHPEYGVATIPFPIPDEEYDHCIELLEALEIGDAVQRDCEVKELHSDYPVLKKLELTKISLDELDYLAKRLDSFDSRETAQFQAMAEKMKLSGIWLQEMFPKTQDRAAGKVLQPLPALSGGLGQG